MTPKDKAKELYLQMLKYQHQSNLYIERKILCPTAKHCALIAVDEILRSHHNLYGVNNKQVKFYSEVKQEIELL
jgi:hypothetical protein